MSQPAQRQQTTSFAKTFVLPALLVFLVPVISLFFFRHAERTFDEQARQGTLQQINDDSSMTPEEREKAIAFFTEVPFSTLILNEEFAANLDAPTLRDYATFRWMIRLAWWSIIAGIVVFVLAGLCVFLSRRSQQAQFLSLSVGWHVLRIYGALQTIIQGAMLVALSFWVTALWFESYYPKLILIAGICAVVAVGLVIKAIFTKPVIETVIQGKVIAKDSSPALWKELSSICTKVGTAPPDQIIAGIDDNFFVTEFPVTVDGVVSTGRTLFVSLSLLKHMRGAEADAVLAHEMAHFSGEDTTYSKRISPLLARYGNYLQALYQGGVTQPIFHFMHCFWALFQLSLGRHSRQREFRADRIAADATSPSDMASALVRVTAYSAFRNNIQREIFKQDQVLEKANISQLIEEGFHNYAVKFAASPDMRDAETAHPFDTHPPLSQRLEAVGVPLNADEMQRMLDGSVAGRWPQLIDGAAEIERAQWDELEKGFREIHEQSLPYRFLPDTDQEREVVLKAFPETVIDGKAGSMTLTYDSIHHAAWPDAVLFREVTACNLDDNGTLFVHFQREGKQKRSIKLKTFSARQQEALDAANRYYSRYVSAKAYREQQSREAEPEAAAAAE